MAKRSEHTCQVVENIAEVYDYDALKFAKFRDLQDTTTKTIYYWVINVYASQRSAVLEFLLSKSIFSSYRTVYATLSLLLSHILDNHHAFQKRYPRFKNIPTYLKIAPIFRCYYQLNIYIKGKLSIGSSLWTRNKWCVCCKWKRPSFFLEVGALVALPRKFWPCVRQPPPPTPTCSRRRTSRKPTSAAWWPSRPLQWRHWWRHERPMALLGLVQFGGLFQPLFGKFRLVGKNKKVASRSDKQKCIK